MESRDRFFEAVSLDEPHGVIRSPAVIRPQAINGDDAGVFEPTGDLGLDQKSLAASRSSAC